MKTLFFALFLLFLPCFGFAQQNGWVKIGPETFPARLSPKASGCPDTTSYAGTKERTIFDGPITWTFTKDSAGYHLFQFDCHEQLSREIPIDPFFCGLNGDSEINFSLGANGPKMDVHSSWRNYVCDSELAYSPRVDSFVIYSFFERSSPTDSISFERTVPAVFERSWLNDTHYFQRGASDAELLPTHIGWTVLSDTAYYFTPDSIYARATEDVFWTGEPHGFGGSAQRFYASEGRFFLETPQAIYHSTHPNTMASGGILSAAHAPITHSFFQEGEFIVTFEEGPTTRYSLQGDSIDLVYQPYACTGFENSNDTLLYRFQNGKTYYLNDDGEYIHYPVTAQPAHGLLEIQTVNDVRYLARYDSANIFQSLVQTTDNQSFDTLLTSNNPILASNTNLAFEVFTAHGSVISVQSGNQIIWTTDRGETWQKVTIEPTVPIWVTTCYFRGQQYLSIDPEGNLLWLDNHLLSYSDDGGQTWKPVVQDNPQSLEAAHFMSISGSVFVVSENLVLRWNPQTKELEQEYARWIFDFNPFDLRSDLKVLNDRFLWKANGVYDLETQLGFTLNVPGDRSYISYLSCSSGCVCEVPGPSQLFRHDDQWYAQNNGWYRTTHEALFSVSEEESTFVICASDTLTIRDSTFTETGNYVVEIPSPDGLVRQYVNLSVIPDSIQLTAEYCSLDTGWELEVDGQSYTFVGTEIHSLATENQGCTTNYIVDLTENAVSKETIEEFLCPGNSYTISGTSTTYSEPGFYEYRDLDACRQINVTLYDPTALPQGQYYFWQPATTTFGVTVPPALRITRDSTRGYSCDRSGRIVEPNINVRAQIDDSSNAALKESISVHPNPTRNGVAQLFIESSYADNIELQIINTLGQVVYQVPLVLSQGITTHEVPLADFGTGLYFARYEGRNGSEIWGRFLVGG